MICKSIAIIGAGKAGTVISRKLFDIGYNFNSVISKHKSSARNLAASINCRIYSDNILSLPVDTRLIIIATPDSEIEKVADELSKCNLGFKTLKVFHISGCLSSDILEALRRKGTTVFSIHPFQTFMLKNASIEILDNISYGIEGDKKGISAAKKIVSDLGGTYFVVPKSMKPLYHLAGVFASNYFITLIDSIDKILSEFVSGANARKNIIIPIIKRSFSNILENGYKKSITGPLVRGDTNTIEQHLKILNKYDKELLKLYKAFGNVSLKANSKQFSVNKNSAKMKKILN
jgi:predicted short-subunit dehydrogenase-like oxidoreductase (DUF2520 family)